MLGALVLMAAAAWQQPQSCEALKALTLPQVTITAAELVAAGQLPAHCRVAALLKPSADSSIQMELWLPTDSWNGKFLAVGNGGWAGSLDTRAMQAGLRRGYATASTDTGHTGGSASFAVGHPEKLIDFAYRAMHEMTVHSKAMIAAFYRRAPQLSYYQGCSTGGRQGMMEAQRYPDDFDAMVVGAPVYNMVHMNVSQVALQVDMLRDPARLVSPAQVKKFADAVVNACDARDGVKDGIVSEPRVCRVDPSVMACKAGDGGDCFTPAQVANARSAWAPATIKGKAVYPGRSPGFEEGWRIPTPGAPVNPLFNDMVRYVARQDPNFDSTTFDFEADLARALKNGGFIEASSPDLAKFKARGGKLLLWHGWADPGPAPENTINYYSHAAKVSGGSQDDWMRLFLMPGVAHCGGGVGPDQADFLGAMERWREQGEAPAQITASRNAGRSGLTPMTRPLCPFPQIAKYKGTGSTDDAANFTCAAP